MYTPQQVAEAALRAANKTVAKLAQDPDFRFVSTEDLIDMSGLAGPTDDDLPTVHKQWGFNLMALREQWRHLILAEIGRWPKTVRGVGFEILEPPKNIEHADTKVINDVVRAIKKGKRIIRQTRNNDLNSQQQKRKINSELRFSQMEASAVNAQAQAERERLWRDQPNPTRSLRPIPQLEDTE